MNAQRADEEDVVGQVDDLQQTIDEFNAAVNASNQQAVKESAEKLRAQLRAFDEDAMRIDAGLGLAVHRADKGLGIGVFANSTVRANLRGDYADSDDQYLTQIIESSNNNPDQINTGDSNGGHQLESSGRIVVAAMTEIGLTLSREFKTEGNSIAFGVSPKVVELRTFDYERSVGEFEEDNFDADEHQTEKTSFNLDLGTAYTFGEKDQWIAAASVRNLIPMDIKTARGEKVEVTPLFTIGMAHRSNWHTLAIDVDLTKNDAFSFEDDTQWLSVGGEVDVFNFLQLRAGARHNLAHNSDTSAGIG